MCKKAAMTRKCGSGIENFMDQKPAWFKKLFPFVASRDLCNPSLASEPSFALVGERDADTGAWMTQQHESRYVFTRAIKITFFC